MAPERDVAANDLEWHPTLGSAFRLGRLAMAARFYLLFGTDEDRAALARLVNLEIKHGEPVK